MSYKDRVFDQQEVELDGNSYTNCRFIRCKLTFAGEAGVNFDNCVFVQCNWNFQGAAATTLSFLSALASGTREGSDASIFDALVGAIKQRHIVGGVTGQRDPELAAR